MLLYNYHDATIEKIITTETKLSIYISLYEIFYPLKPRLKISFDISADFEKCQNWSTELIHAFDKNNSYLGARLENIEIQTNIKNEKALNCKIICDGMDQLCFNASAFYEEEIGKEKCIDIVNPTAEDIIQWGYDEDMLFIEQDEELLLNRITYLSALILLAEDSTCPKQKLCIELVKNFKLGNSLQQNTVVAFCSLPIMKADVKLSNETLTKWKNNFLTVASYIINPRVLNEQDCKIILDIILEGLVYTPSGQAKNGFIEYCIKNKNKNKIVSYFYLHPIQCKWFFSYQNQLPSDVLLKHTLNNKLRLLPKQPFTVADFDNIAWNLGWLLVKNIKPLEGTNPYEVVYKSNYEDAYIHYLEDTLFQKNYIILRGDNFLPTLQDLKEKIIFETKQNILEQTKKIKNNVATKEQVTSLAILANEHDFDNDIYLVLTEAIQHKDLHIRNLAANGIAYTNFPQFKKILHTQITIEENINLKNRLIFLEKYIGKFDSYQKPIPDKNKILIGLYDDKVNNKLVLELKKYCTKSLPEIKKALANHFPIYEAILFENNNSSIINEIQFLIKYLEKEKLVYFIVLLETENEFLNIETHKLNIISKGTLNKLINTII
jgi:hypothetical protein